MVKQLCKAYSIGVGGTVVTTGSSLPNVPSSPSLGDPNHLTIGVWSNDNATTITIFVSYDNGVTWMKATTRGTDTPVSISLAGSGAGQAVEIVPAPNVKIVSSAACLLTAYANITN